jgi:outer membrane protein, heavy metal efflux system
MNRLKRVLLGLILFAIHGQGYTQTRFTLPQALQIARANNPELKTQFLNIALAGGDVVQAKLRPNPKLNNQSLQIASPNSFASTTDWYSPLNHQIWWQLTKPIQLPAQRRNKIELAEQVQELTKKNYTELERNLFVAVGQQWLEVWLAQKELQIIQVAKLNIDSLLLINRLRYDKQVITQTDLLRTQQLVDRYALQIRASKQRYSNQLKNLQLLLGGAVGQIDSTAVFVPPLVGGVDSLLSQALAQRADLQAARTNVEVSATNIRLQKSLALPQPELGLIYNPQNTVPYVGFYGTLDLPVFSRNQGEVLKSRHLKAQAEQGLQALQLKAQTEVQTAYATYLMLQQNVEAYQAILAQSENILQSVKYAYLKGGTTIIDFLEAQRSWLDTQQTYNNTLFEYRRAYIQLLFATGLINQLAQ